MVVFPPCKINLGLNILRKRADGYHDIETCFYPIPWTDMLEIIPSSDFSFSSSGNLIEGKPEDNLCLRAYGLLKEDFDLPPVSMHLHKIIPTGAGLGGGSSDAAHTLRILNQIFNLQLSATQLSAYASRLGSDCPFFVYDQPMMGRGRGELLSPVNLSLTGKFLILVKPEVHVSTAAAYAGVSAQVPAISLDQIIAQPLPAWKDLLQNDFEKSVFQTHPELAVVKTTLYALGARYASMSGSGSTVFGIFDQPVEFGNRAHFTCWSATL